MGSEERERWLLMPIAAAIAATACALLLYARFSPEPGIPTELHSVSLEELSDNGILMVPPAEGATPIVTRREAESKVLDRYDGVSVKEAAFVHVRTARWDTNAWVVSLNPNGFDHSGRGGTTVYLLSFVDAATGDLLFTFSETTPPPEGFNYPPRFSSTATPAEPAR